MCFIMLHLTVVQCVSLSSTLPAFALNVQQRCSVLGYSGLQWPGCRHYMQACHHKCADACGLSWYAKHVVVCAGMIATKCCPSQVVGDAVMDARSICMREYASAPEVNIYGDPNFTFPYVPSHLHHMTFELVKNSLRAVNDKYDDSDDEPPPIRLVVAEGEEDITIKVYTAVLSQARKQYNHQCQTNYLHRAKGVPLFSAQNLGFFTMTCLSSKLALLFVMCPSSLWLHTVLNGV